MHADGIRGMLFHYDDERKEVVTTHNVVYFCEEDAQGNIVDSGFCARDFSTHQRPSLFYNDTLDRAFVAANSV